MAFALQYIIVSYVQVRLANTHENSYGRLEILYNNTWGTVCHDGFTMQSANVVCKQLGFYKGAANFYGGAVYGPGNGTIWLTNVTCSGNEGNIAGCTHSYWGKTLCNHSQDVSIVCDPGKTLCVERTRISDNK